MVEAEEQLRDSLSDLPTKTIDAITRYIDLAVNKKVDRAIDERADIRATCSGRLTLLTATPVTTADQTGKGTIYFTPYNGSKVSLYDGTNWKLYAFTEVNLALTVTSEKNYDVFLYDSSGTLTLTLSDAWTNDTAREDALGTLNGVYVNSVTLTLGTVVPNTGRYLGTIRASAANATEDSVTKRFVWNNYNRIQRALTVTEGTGSWTYAIAAWRQARATATNQVGVVVGLREDSIHVVLEQLVSPLGFIGIGVNSITALSGIAMFHQEASTSVVEVTYTEIPRLGYTYYAWLEYAFNATSRTFYGDVDSPLIYGTASLSGQIKN